jgi:predicted nucleotidyltransferase
VRRIERALRGIVADLRELDRPFALLGGFAVSARVEPRTTRDIDLAVDVRDDDDAEQVAFGLSRRGYVIRTAIEQLESHRLATIRTVSPAGTIVDLLFASSGIEAEVIAASTTVEVLDGLEIPVASVGHIIAMKVLARDDRRRPQDRLDLQALLERASSSDLEQARAALELVTARGYARGRALREELASALEEFRR